MTSEAAFANPYVGPRTFSYEQRNLFFGREREARDLLARVLSERLLLFYAQSGAGKSSLLHTRLIPQLQEDKGFVVLPVGRVSGELLASVGDVDNIYAYNLMLSIDEGDDPARLAHVTLSDFLARLARRGVVDALGQERKGWVYDSSLVPTPPASDPSARRYALIVDQFEEIVTTHPERWREREGFFRQLNQAMQADPNLWVVLTMREDFVAALDPYAALMADRLRGRFYMERMAKEAALEAIREPARLGGRPFAEDVAEKLVDDLRQVRLPGQDATVVGQYVEPVQLQVVCYQLWERVQGGTQITEADLAAGDVDQALEQFYNDTLSAVLAEPEVQEAGVKERALRGWFDKDLITDTGIRNTLLRNETAGRTGSMPNAAVDALARRFLLRSELRGGGVWVELVHDRFVEPIQSANRRWLAKNQNPLTQRAADWQQAGRPAAKLLKGDRLKDAQAQVQSHPADFSALERDYVVASVEAERQTKSRRQRLLVTAAVVLTVAFGLLATVALVSARNAKRAETTAQAEKVKAIAAGEKADTARQDAEAQEEKANEARQNALILFSLADALSTGGAEGTQPERSALGTIGLIQFARDLEIHELSEVVGRLERTLASLGALPLRGHESAVNTVAFVPACAGSASAESCTPRLASGGADGAVRLWDVRHPFTEPVTLSGHIGSVRHIAFSPDGRWLASSGDDFALNLWDLAAATPLSQTLSADGALYRLDFSPTGRWLVAAATNGTTRLWDMATAPQLVAQQLSDPTASEAINAVFSRNEQTLMTTTRSGNGSEVKLWQSGDGFAQPTARYTYDYIAGSAMSPDGKWLAVSTPTTTELRTMGADADSGAGVVQSFPGFGYLYAMDFSPDSRSVSSGSYLWRLNDQGQWDEPVRLVGQPQEGVYSPIFSRDSRWMAAVGSDYAVYRWDLRDLTRLPYVYRGHEGNVNDLAFSPDAALLATAGGDSVVRLWKAHSPTAGPVILHQPGDQAEVRLWDVSTADPAQTSRLVGSRPDDYRLIAISPDGRYAAVANEGGNSDVLLWDTTRPSSQARTLDHPGAVMAMRFSPGCIDPAKAPADTCDHWLAVGDWSGNVRMWNPNAPEGDSLSYVDLPSGASIRDLAFSADNRLLVTGDQWSQASVWRIDPVDPTQTPLVLRGHSSIVRTVAISPSGRWVVTGAWEPDLTTRLWDLSKSTSDPVAILPFAGRLFTAAFSPDERWAAVGSWDYTAALFRLDDPASAPIRLDQHRGRILSMAISSDSRWLATGGEDRRVILWDLTAPDPSTAFAVLRSPTGSGSGVNVDFSADSRWLAAFGSGDFSSQAPWLASAGNDVHLYSLPLDDLINRVCLAVGRNLTDEEWQRYLPGQPAPLICPEPGQNPLAKRLEAQSLLLDGDDQAIAGDVEGALALYRQASDLDPSLAVATDGAAEQHLVEVIVARGQELAGEGELDRATQLFAQAVALDPTLAIDPRTEAQRLFTERQQQETASLTFPVLELINQSAYSEAMEKLAEVEAANPTLVITSTLSADNWNVLCWRGALAGEAQAVLLACDRAVMLEPDDGGILDSRGLARALTGDVVGAVADLEFALQWAQATGFGQDFVDSRQAWIAALRSGRNPFDEATLQALRDS